MSNLAVVYRLQSKFADAERLSIRTMEIRSRVLGDSHPDTLTTMNNLAATYKDEGKYDEAEPLYIRMVDLFPRVFGEAHPNTLTSMSSLADLYELERQYAKAESIARDLLRRYEKSFPDNWARFYAQVLLGAGLSGQLKFAEAEPLLLSGYEGLKQREATIPATIRSPLARAEETIIQLYHGWSKAEKEAEWRGKLSQRNLVQSGR
jgi:tetratricopeptide (TPR) repeat protein